MAKTITGVVVSNKTDKTIVVNVVTHKTHALYRKAFVTSKKFMAHDEKNEANEGDTVVIAETRPLSAKKRHVLQTILERAAITAADSVEAVAADEPAEVKKPAKVKKAEEKVEEENTEEKA